jgi:hypothetical protein
MSIVDKHATTFSLRLATSLKDSANHFAEIDGISLNHFISLAVAEKISRLESETLREQADVTRKHRIAVAPTVLGTRSRMGYCLQLPHLQDR